MRMLNEIDGVVCPEPEGAFYVYPSVKALLGKEIRGKRPQTSVELAALILDEAEVAVVPGEAFGTPGYLRLSYALGDEDLVEGVSRIQKLLARGHGLTHVPDTHSVRRAPGGSLPGARPRFHRLPTGRTPGKSVRTAPQAERYRNTGSCGRIFGWSAYGISACCRKPICICTSPGRCGPPHCWNWPTSTASICPRR